MRLPGTWPSTRLRAAANSAATVSDVSRVSGGGAGHADTDRASGKNHFALGAVIFFRALGVIHFVAFLSFWVQLDGLIGPKGILPASAFLNAVREQLHGDAFFALPTLCWFFGANGFLHVLCAVGVGASVLLIAGVAPVISLAVLWICYLSLVNVGQIFLSFQWDILLLETTWLAALAAPRALFPGWRLVEPPPLARWLLLWLLFRLILLSGVVKLTSGDPTWRALTALSFHYETQPLPNPLSWWAYHLPLGVHRFTCAATFAVELAAPWLLFAPRLWRHISAVLIIGLQLAIGLTGNFAFFNFLTAALCLLAFDDEAWRRLPLFSPVLARLGVSKMSMPAARTGQPLRVTAVAVGLFTTIIAVPVIVPRLRLPAIFSGLYESVSSLYLANNYGLFAVMTTSRSELIFEGSDDGRTWLAYELPDKPGDLARRPPFVAPHQPRLDWQLWFAALTTPDQNLWVSSVCEHLLHGTPDVLALFAKNPFPIRPPLLIRVVRYDYHFTRRDERARTGKWWHRTLRDIYEPPSSLNNSG